jgi:hypothetical protein
MSQVGLVAALALLAHLQFVDEPRSRLLHSGHRLNYQPEASAVS